MADDIFVIDASIGVKWYIPEDYSDLALGILKILERPSTRLCAPISFKVEFTNAIRKYLIRGIISKEIANDILIEIESVPIKYYDLTWKLVRNAFKYAIQRNITVYDAIYIVLTKELSARFITADKKLYSAIQDESGVVFITDVKMKLA